MTFLDTGRREVESARDLPPQGIFISVANLSVLYPMEVNEKLPWYRDSQTEPPFRLTTYFKVRRVCSAPCHVLQRD